MAPMSKEQWFREYEREYDHRLAAAEEMRYLLALERLKADIEAKKKESK